MTEEMKVTQVNTALDVMSLGLKAYDKKTVEAAEKVIREFLEEGKNE